MEKKKNYKNLILKKNEKATLTLSLGRKRETEGLQPRSLRSHVTCQRLIGADDSRSAPTEQLSNSTDVHAFTFNQ